MRLVIQRVSEAKLYIENKLYSQINKGIVALLAVGENDDEKASKYLLDKLLNLRIFPDDEGVMNLSLLDTKAELMIVSQFTLYGDCRKGRRPSYSQAMKPELAEKFYSRFVEMAKEQSIKVVTGKFQTMMNVNLVNSGPVTLILDSNKLF